MQKEFPFLKVVDKSESELLCSFCDGKFNVADGERTTINQHIKTQNHDKIIIVKECHYEPTSTSEASMT